MHAGFGATVADLDEAATRLQHSVRHDRTFLMPWSVERLKLPDTEQARQVFVWLGGGGQGWQGGGGVETGSVIGRHASSADYVLCLHILHACTHLCDFMYTMNQSPSIWTKHLDESGSPADLTQHVSDGVRSMVSTCHCIQSTLVKD